MYTYLDNFSLIVRISLPIFLYIGSILIISSTILNYYSALVNKETQQLKNEREKLKFQRNLRKITLRRI